MNPYYDTKEKREAFISEARSWRGTKFMARCGIKGYGADCVHMAALTYVVTGLMKEFNPPTYDVKAGLYLGKSQIESFIECSSQFVEVTGQTPQTGDAACLRMYRVSHHVGIVTVGTLFMHTYYMHCAHEADLADPTWRKRLVKLYRPIQA